MAFLVTMLSVGSLVNSALQTFSIKTFGFRDLFGPKFVHFIPPCFILLCPPADVPDSSIILRAHTPLSNLLSCLWFNEVARFTPRDQLSFAFVRDKVMAGALSGWYVNMFLDCERLNFVKFIRHRKAPDLSLQHEMEREESE